MLKQCVFLIFILVEINGKSIFDNDPSFIRTMVAAHPQKNCKGGETAMEYCTGYCINTINSRSFDVRFKIAKKNNLNTFLAYEWTWCNN